MVVERRICGHLHRVHDELVKSSKAKTKEKDNEGEEEEESEAAS